MSGVSNILSHLKPLSITVSLEGRSYDIPAMDAVSWVAVLADPGTTFLDVFPGLADPAVAEEVEDLLWDGVVDDKQIRSVALDVITAAGDRPWWVTMRILAMSADVWDRIHVNDAVGKSLAGWLDEVWSSILRHLDPKKIASFTNEIEAAPKGYEAEMNFDAEEQAFLSAMRAVAT